MPKFVPVVDSEKPVSEQSGSSEYDKHRSFDAPHALHGSKKVDRGWQQGNVGWGVLGSFGSANKDDSAQVATSKSEGPKMVKNEKGLWVKAKDIVENSSVGRRGAGRGGGVSVLQEYNDSISKSSAHSKYDEDSEQFRDATPRQVFDEYDYKGKKNIKPAEQTTSRSHYYDRSPSRSPKKQDNNRDSRHSDYRRSSHRDDRSRSRSPKYNRYSRNRQDSRDRFTQRDKRGRSRSRSDSRDRQRRRPTSNGKRYDDNDDDDASGRYGERQQVGNKANYVEHKQQQQQVSETSNEVNVHDKKQQEDVEVAEEEEEEGSFDFTVVQVVNRFHEVFATATPSDPSVRISSIIELFQPDAFIASLKNESNVYLKDSNAIGESFLKTNPSVPVISKRVFVDSAAVCAHSKLTCEGSKPERITFCLDFHRAGTAPGLGDKTKDGVLLYRCVNSRLTSIYGMVDGQKLASDSNLTVENVMASPVWVYALRLIQKDIPTLQNSDVVFHNYDKMEVWG